MSELPGPDRMSELPPDEELPRKLDAIEQTLATNQHKWFARATLLAVLATGITLLLPWTFSRRLGLSVWQLGIETQPSLAVTWLVGLLAAIAALVLNGSKAQVASSVTGIIAILFIAGAWQANSLAALTDTWPGPGPAVATVTGIAWLLAATTHLLATTRSHPTTPPTPEALEAATAHLRHARTADPGQGGEAGFTRAREEGQPGA